MNPDGTGTLTLDIPTTFHPVEASSLWITAGRIGNNLAVPSNLNTLTLRKLMSSD